MKSSFSPTLSGLFYTLLIVIIGSLLTALILKLTSVREASIPYFTYGINTLALLIGGFIAGKRSQQRGWYSGGLTGLMYGIVILLIGFLAFDAIISWIFLAYILVSFVLGAIGGILGVNMKK
ncbi:TIGR04086 family membrane protein [Microaerobacter geothermalis]|uniref:TIGR04086 family membrane protein n=1 Tax=Microaerobacter geothermalis TaxID=674972 RepID=UPI001F47C9A0|nr:TIGR04086 family membrane protein [Microaerobacter geothermalis]MCF6092753.1 TIGR04086 family membrane protein [Microaerobacter geothermalis]